MNAKRRISISKLKECTYKTRSLDSKTTLYALDDIANRLHMKAFHGSKIGLMRAVAALVKGFAGTVSSDEPLYRPVYSKDTQF